MHNIVFREEDFKIWKNKMIIRIINKSENVEWISDNLMNNYSCYDLCQYDDIDYIKSLNYEEMVSFITNLDLSNYVVAINVGDDKNEGISN